MNKTVIFIIIILILIPGLYFWFVGYQKSPGTQNEEPKIAGEIALEQIADNLVSPVAFVSAYDDTQRMFIVDQIGLIKIVDSQGKVLNDNFLDIKSKLVDISANYDERGLLGLAFHPDYKKNGRFFVYYSARLRSSAPEGYNHTSVLSEFTVSKNNPNMADLNSEKIILQIDQPQFNHNGGHIAFGPDGYLYIPLGDGGQADDTGLGHTADIGNAQDLSKPLGKILRIDVDNGTPYSVPADNPFVNKDGLDEIYAFGFRNPYHISFDAAGNNDLFVADVGQNLWEEVDIVNKGGNYGWRIREGKHCFDPGNPKQSPASCATKGAGGESLIDPIIDYAHPMNGGIGTAIIGGYVYRGKEIADLLGKYVFADFSRDLTKGDGILFSASSKNGQWSFDELRILNNANGKLNLFVKGIGEDADNELYLLTSETVGPSGASGKIFKIVGSLSGTNQAEERVTIKNFSFNPQTLTVSKGTKVIWTNEDPVPHIVAGQGDFKSNIIPAGDTFSFIFNEAGTFNYVCGIHPSMKGSIIVK